MIHDSAVIVPLEGLLIMQNFRVHCRQTLVLLWNAIKCPLTFGSRTPEYIPHRAVGVAKIGVLFITQIMSLSMR